MSEDLLLPVSINEWLLNATEQLKQAGIQTARLDALLLLADELQQDKSWLLAHLEQFLTEPQLGLLDNKLAKRQSGRPLAYIRGEQEFFGRSFHVTPAVLIPRPETEALIGLLLELKPQANDVLIDVGTGSGALAITAKLERPELYVFATDISPTAIHIAQKNAKRLRADITFLEQNLLNVPSPQSVRFIVANLPYVAINWKRSPETDYEPAEALFADDDGCALIKKLITQSGQSLQSYGYLLLEADPRQHQAIISFAKSHGYTLEIVRDFAITLRRGSES